MILARHSRSNRLRSSSFLVLPSLRGSSEGIGGGEPFVTGWVYAGTLDGGTVRSVRGPCSARRRDTGEAHGFAAFARRITKRTRRNHT
jgi:hypothetical protein